MSTAVSLSQIISRYTFWVFLVDEKIVLLWPWASPHFIPHTTYKVLYVSALPAFWAHHHPGPFPDQFPSSYPESCPVTDFVIRRINVSIVVSDRRIWRKSRVRNEYWPTKKHTRPEYVEIDSARQPLCYVSRAKPKYSVSRLTEGYRRQRRRDLLANTRQRIERSQRQ